MITAKTYENGFRCVKNAIEATRYTDDIAAILRAAEKPLSCKEVGRSLFGNNYNNGYSSHTASSVSHVLEGMVRSGCVKCERVEGSPIQIEKETWLTADTDRAGNPRVIKVHDDEGNEYEMPNPKYRAISGIGGYWGKVRKTIPTSYKVYTWVG